MKIYVSGAYSADAEEIVLDNVHKAIDVGIELFKMGHIPFIPHLTHWVEKRAIRTAQGSIPYEKWLEYDSMWLDMCDAIFVIGRSSGADQEILHAVERKMWVYTSLIQVPYHGELETTEELKNAEQCKHRLTTIVSTGFGSVTKCVNCGGILV